MNIALLTGFFWYWSYYPHRSRDALSPICEIKKKNSATSHHLLFQLTGLKLGSGDLLQAKKEEEERERRERLVCSKSVDRSDTWTTVSLASSAHTSHSNPLSYKKGEGSFHIQIGIS